MFNLIGGISNYIIILLMGIYTFSCFSIFAKSDERVKKRILLRQNVIMFMIHFVAYSVLFMRSGDVRLLGLYLSQVVLFLATIILYNIVYPRVSRLIVNNMCMLICIGYIMLARLNFGEATNQLLFGVLGVSFGLFVPIIIKKFKFLSRWRWIYAIIGISALMAVALFAAIEGGARRGFTVAGFGVQPSEVVKILFVFFVAACLVYSTTIKDLMITSIFAGVHVIILVWSVDLGTSVTLFVVYVIMIYVATRKLLYAFAGVVFGAFAAWVGYQTFAHVRVRVAVWQDPLYDYFGIGNQLSNSLFAIGSGGWFGLGLYRGVPGTISEVTRDFMFSAIAEELGILFALCLVLICVSCYVMILNIAMDLKQPFYKFVALGLGTTYIFQVFLTIGGAIRLIPSTGVTLPLVSYGGSSFMSTMVMFGIIQGLYILRQDEEEDMSSQRKRDSYEEMERSKSSRRDRLVGGRAHSDEGFHPVGRGRPSRNREQEPTFEEVPKQRVR
jgi:cell division protein FtsW (lipid II flippase)